MIEILSLKFKPSCAQHSENGDLNRQSFASLSGADNYKLTFLPGFNNNIIFPGKIGNY